MPRTKYRGRRASYLENQVIRLTVLEEGGHIAEILDKRSGVNPLWTPPWNSIEPSTYYRDTCPEYGDGPDASLLSGIMGHSLCLDAFGAPSEDEIAAGIPVHGEASTASFEIHETPEGLTANASLPRAALSFGRQIELRSATVRIVETVHNLSAFDRPIAWTEHVTLGTPFLEQGITQFRASATRSKVFESKFGSADYLIAGTEFEWPQAPQSGGGRADLRVLNAASISSAFSTHLMDPRREHAFFVAFAPAYELAFGYVWKQADFPWMAIWEENHSRMNQPWSGRTLARGMEFGVSPFPESRREMIERNKLFGVPTYRWLSANSHIAVEYWALARHVRTIPDVLEGPSRLL